MSACAMRGAEMNPLFMHDKSPVKNFLFRFKRFLIFGRFDSFVTDVLFDWNTNVEFVFVAPAKFPDNDVNYASF